MKLFGIWVLLFVGLVGHRDGAVVQDDATADDSAVIAAVLDATILPAYRRANADTTTPLPLVGETTPMCLERPTGKSRCGIPEQWRQFLEPDAARKWAGLVADPQTRQELVASLEVRNTESRPLPLASHVGVVLLDLRKDPPANPLDRHYRRKIGSASISLPGYSRNRQHAIAYGSYSCGNLCGYGWLFVLERVDGKWRLKSATVTAVS